jgi:hypothetical protein
VMAVSESTGRWEDLIRLLRTLSEEEVAAVQALVEEVARRRAAVQEARTSYVLPTETAKEAAYPDERGHPPTLNLSTPEESLDFLASGPPGFLPGELDQLLADIEYARKMELEAPCQRI